MAAGSAPSPSAQSCDMVRTRPDARSMISAARPPVSRSRVVEPSGPVSVMRSRSSVHSVSKGMAKRKLPPPWSSSSGVKLSENRRRPSASRPRAGRDRTPPGASAARHARMRVPAAGPRPGRLPTEAGSLAPSHAGRRAPGPTQDQAMVESLGEVVVADPMLTLSPVGTVIGPHYVMVLLRIKQPTESRVVADYDLCPQVPMEPSG